ncbi:DUF4955 domain-containing protein [bacterium]|nr:DUF4955 domain-containing protein [bacterium]
MSLDRICPHFATRQTRSMKTYTIIAALLSAPALGANPSALYQAFVDAQSGGGTPVLPDFSYSGYRRSEVAIPDVTGTVFDVTDYGAVADDGASDASAIQAAIDAAEANGSGIVFFPPGRFHLNTAADAGAPITMNAGGIVWRGSGMGEGGTELYMERNFEADDPAVLTSTPFMIQMGPLTTSEGTAATITANAARGSFSVQVASASNLSVGQWVQLALTSTAAVDSFFGSYGPPDASWTDLIDTGIVVREKHQVKSISGNIVTFEQPLQVDIDTTYAWTIRRYTILEEVGIEDIAFVGNWQGSFVHHRSALDDGGWSGLSLNRLVNSWVRRCRFTDWNYTIFMESCSQFTLLHCLFDGTPGHHTIHTRRGYGVLMGLSDDDASHYHSYGVGYQSHSTVFWRCTYNSDTSWDSHSGLPYATLLDAMEGGMMYGHAGGPLDSMPNHMRRFTLWNFNHTGTAVSNFDFWRSNPNSRDRYLLPIISGFHGSSSTFDTSDLEAYESPGFPVDPESLFEAQLALRLGSAPAWIEEAKDEWQVILNGTPAPTLVQPLPNSVWGPGSDVPLQATVASGEEGLVAQMEFLADGSTVATDSIDPWEQSWLNAPAGTWGIRGRVVDGLGSTSTSSRSVIYVGALPQPEVPVTGVVASTEDGVNVATNVLDGDLGTRWSASGDGATITFDLGSVAAVNRIDLSWYQGDTRTSDFRIELSDDGSAWREALELTSSSGTTLAAQTTYFTGGPARFVRLVGYGNSVNDWNSITEARLYSPSVPSSSVGDNWIILGEAN